MTYQEAKKSTCDARKDNEPKNRNQRKVIKDNDNNLLTTCRDEETTAAVGKTRAELVQQRLYADTVNTQTRTCNRHVRNAPSKEISVTIPARKSGSTMLKLKNRKQNNPQK